MAGKIISAEIFALEDHIAAIKATSTEGAILQLVLAADLVEQSYEFDDGSKKAETAFKMVHSALMILVPDAGGFAAEFAKHYENTNPWRSIDPVA